MGIISDDDGRVLVSRRPPGKTMASAWEFPGGKLVRGESRVDGLARELEEELGIKSDSARPFIRYQYSYADFTVDLDFWRVTHWRGEPESLEGQSLAWRRPAELFGIGLLPADIVAVRALKLPASIAVTPPVASKALSDAIDSLGRWPSGLICLRQPGWNISALREFMVGAAQQIVVSGSRLLLHGDPEKISQLIGDSSRVFGSQLASTITGLHVPAHYLARLRERPVPRPLLFGSSCHNARELAVALALDADYAFLGPVKPTASHPGEPGMGWEKFAALVQELPLPVYAIGGLGPADLETAWAAGAQGIAAIRGLWPR